MTSARLPFLSDPVRSARPSVRRRELTSATRRAVGLGKTLDQYRSEHDRDVENLTTAIRAAMDSAGVSDPTELLPEILTNLREEIIAEARSAGRTAAVNEVKRMLKRVIT
jgi:hypothetical protein